MDPFWSVHTISKKYCIFLKIIATQYSLGSFPIKMYTIWYFVLECFNSEASVVILRVCSDCSAYCSTATLFVEISRQMVTPTLLRPRTTTEVARVQCKSWTASLFWATEDDAVTGTSTCRRRVCVMTSLQPRYAGEISWSVRLVSNVYSAGQ